MKRWWIAALGAVTVLLLLSACSPGVAAGGETAVSETMAEPLSADTSALETLSAPATSTPTEIPATSTIPPTATMEPTETPLPTETPTPLLPPAETPTPAPTYPPPPEEVRVPILMYHYISDLPPDADVYRRDLTVRPEVFAGHLDYLKQQGYSTVRLADIYETLTTGKPLPEKPIVLTFDDGYKDAYTNVLPMLLEYGFVGEFFVLATPAHYEAPAYLTWDEIRAMADAGMSMQAHGRDHYDLTNRPYDFLVYQILGSREAIEAHTDQPVRFFCYPSGRYDDDAISVVASAGYWGAVTTEWGTSLRLDNRYRWPRIRIRGGWSVENFIAVISELQP